jgi:hypothetical protein
MGTVSGRRAGCSNAPAPQDGGIQPIDAAVAASRRPTVDRDMKRLSVLTRTASRSFNLYAQTLERAKQNPGTPIVTGLLREVTPTPIEELAKGATLILEGRTNRVIAGRAVMSQGSPTVTPSLIVSAYGGEVQVDGTSIRSTDHNLEDLRTGVQYLLFLKKFGSEPGRYEFYRGGVFEIHHDRVKALLKGSKDVYSELSDQPYSQVIQRVERAHSTEVAPR